MLHPYQNPRQCGDLKIEDARSKRDKLAFLQPSSNKIYFRQHSKHTV
jgi:hypothetical protein